MADDTSTPYLDSLSDAQRDYVYAKAQETRPTYFSATLAESLASQGQPLDGALLTISKDTEAFLILLPASTKSSLLTWIQAMVAAAPDFDSLALYDEILSARLKGFKQTVSDVGGLVKQFNNFRLQLSPPVTIADVASLITALQNGYQTILFEQDAESHHRIVDSMAVADAKAHKTGYRAQEINSWSSVIVRYL